MGKVVKLEINGIAYKRTDIQNISMPDKLQSYWEIVYKNGMIIWATGNITIVMAGR
jgi:hypothetical protein